MNRIFGKKKETAPPPNLGDVGQRVDARVGNLDAKIKQLENELRDYQKKMKKARGAALTNLKRRAMQVLKRKKMYEQQRDQMSAQSFNLEQTNFALDTVKDTQETVAAMKGAAAALKVEHKKINIDAIEDTQDDLAEMMFDMNEIQESLGRSFGLPDEVDECDLDAELDMLGDELEEDGLGDEVGDAMPDYLQPAPAMPVVGDPSANDQVDEFGLPIAPPSGGIAAPAAGVPTQISA